jgi:hypothetical protein
MLLWGKNAEAYNNDTTELANKAEFMQEWRRDGPLGILLSVITSIKTPQQYALFGSFQRSAHRELPVEQRKVLEPVNPVVTRWNSYYSCFERAVQLQSAVNAYANSRIQRIRNEDAYALSQGNKLPEAQPWMRSDSLTAVDWAIVTEYMDVLRPLKECTNRLGGCGEQGGIGAVAEIIPVFEYLLGVYVDRLQNYNDIVHDEHDKAPKDHLAINL